jgi:N-methylhydantoinase B
MATSRPRLNPVLYEILRHRLWVINDEQGLTAARISGSPAIYEAYDYNAALLDADGSCLFVGVYNTQQGSCIEFVVRDILERFAGRIHDGDAFITNDPWVGAMHMNDTVMVAPIFYEDKLICWSGISMHEMDVGGPVPGSFVVGATDVYGEAPLIPPLKIVERNEFRPEVEELFLRNTRTPQMNKVNIRARWASAHVTRRAILQIVEKYGLETFHAVLDEVRREVKETVASRLRELPDAVLEHAGYLDHDGNEDRLYAIKLKMTKRDDRLILDFAGTSPQAPGMINSTLSGLIGGVMAAALPLLCFDLPWASGVLEELIEIRSEEGTVNNARYPAAVSMSSISATWMTWNLVSTCLGRLFAASDAHRDEAQACWHPGFTGCVISGLDQRGDPLAAIILDSVAGGGGARTHADGVDTGGYLAAVSASIANVETNERLYPILQLWRKERGDTAGHGKYRGGVGLEFAFVPHKAPVPIEEVVFGTCNEYPGASGIWGGLPGSVQRQLIARQSNVEALLSSGTVPTSLDEIERADVEVLPPKGFSVLNHSDVHIIFLSGGGGYGDSLERSPELVASDVTDGLLDSGIAHRLYGVVLSDGAVNIDATETRRREIREERLRTGTGPVSGESNSVKKLDRNEVQATQTLADALIVAPYQGSNVLACSKCGHIYGASTVDSKAHAVMRELSIEEISPLNEYGNSEDFVIREFFCPSCLLRIAADVQLRSEEPRTDLQLLVR